MPSEARMPPFNRVFRVARLVGAKPTHCPPILETTIARSISGHPHTMSLLEDFTSAAYPEQGVSSADIACEGPARLSRRPIDRKRIPNRLRNVKVPRNLWQEEKL